jgi:hypothetical protein
MTIPRLLFELLPIAANKKDRATRQADLKAIDGRHMKKPGIRPAFSFDGCPGQARA